MTLWRKTYLGAITAMLSTARGEALRSPKFNPCLRLSFTACAGAAARLEVGAAQTRGDAGNGFRRRPPAWSAERRKGSKGTHDVSIYEIRVHGRLDAHWAAWFEGLTLAYDGDTTVLRGSLIDEAALHGVLSKVAGLNLHLLSVTAVEMEVTDSATLATPATPDTSPPLGREPEPLDAPPSEPLAGTPVPAQNAPKRKARPPHKRPQKRPTP